MKNVKIVFLGPSGVGKTSLKKIFFEHSNPIDLIQKSLEPTFGVETTFYDLKTTIAVHDLAGQQLNEWLGPSNNVFKESDLIICVLNSKSSWQKNEKLWKEINDIRKQLCPESKLFIFYHKIDLLNEEERNSLESKIKSTFNGQETIHAYSTSITKNFFIKTFRIFISLMKSVSDIRNTVELKKVITRTELLNELIENDQIDIISLLLKFNETWEEIKPFFIELEKLGYIEITIEKNLIVLSEKGKNFIKELKESIGHSIERTILPEFDYIRGFILSDTDGRVIFSFESIPGFLDQMISQEEKSSKVLLFSSLFSVISKFGQSLNEEGFSTMKLSGKNIELITIRYKKILAIFLLNLLKADDNVMFILNKMLGELLSETEIEIKIFLLTGDISEFRKKNNKIISIIKQKNEELHTIKVINKEYSEEKLSQLYQQINQSNIQESVKKSIKTLIFNYLLTNDSSLIQEINTFIIQNKL
ncbi:MAG: hypothetical protein ACTSWY_07135 [Promethearchaeota archaeon]